jgi:hypothetical protein
MTEPKTLSAFGPKVLGWKLDENLITEMNKDCVYVTHTDNYTHFDRTQTLIGQIKLQADFSKEFLHVHGHWFTERAEEFMSVSGNKPIKLCIKDAWYNRTQEPGEYNPEHVHPTSMLTSVGYLKLPSNYKKELTRRDLKNGVGGGLELFYGEMSNFNTTKMTLIPDEGDFFVFPATLRHAVYPMPDTVIEERRSFSLNFEPE